MLDPVVRLATRISGYSLLSEEEIELIAHERMMQDHPTSRVQHVRHLGVELGILMARHAAMARQQDIVSEVRRLDAEAAEERKVLGVTLWALIISNTVLAAFAAWAAVRLWF